MERKHTPPYNICIQAYRNLVHITLKAPECLLQMQYCVPSAKSGTQCSSRWVLQIRKNMEKWLISG